MSIQTIAVYDAETDEWVLRSQTAEEIEAIASVPDPDDQPSTAPVLELPLPPTLPAVPDPVQ